MHHPEIRFVVMLHVPAQPRYRAFQSLEDCAPLYSEVHASGALHRSCEHALRCRSIRKFRRIAALVRCCTTRNVGGFEIPRFPYQSRVLNARDYIERKGHSVLLPVAAIPL
jgi:hypothetical protein